MKTATIAPPRRVTVNRSQGLYVIPSGGGFSCLGFQVCIDRATRLAGNLGEPLNLKRAGTLHNYRELERLQGLAAARNRQTGWRADCELSPQLRGLEGRRVEVVTTYGETRRFIVGRSGGWVPIHLEIHNRRSYGGGAADRVYKSVRLV
jgi:hypothetical protein